LLLLLSWILVDSALLPRRLRCSPSQLLLLLLLLLLLP
jgi:hypothetical protein